MYSVNIVRFDDFQICSSDSVIVYSNSDSAQEMVTKHISDTTVERRLYIAATHIVVDLLSSSRQVRSEDGASTVHHCFKSSRLS